MQSEKDTAPLPHRFTVWGDLLAVAIIFLAATLAATLCLAAIKSLAPDLGLRELTVIVYTVQFLLAVSGAYIYYRRSSSDSGRRGRLFRFSFNWFDAPLTLLGIVLVMAASIVLEPVLNLFPERWFEQIGNAVGSGGWAIVFTVVLAPVFEELFFRGLVLGQTVRRWRAMPAVAISALLFGLVHLPNLPQMVNALVMGVVMGYIYILTRSLIPVIVIHAVNNAVAYLFLEMTGTQSTDTRAMIGNDAVYWTLFGASAVILVVSLVTMARAAGNKTKGKTLLQKPTTDDRAQ